MNLIGGQETHGILYIYLFCFAKAVTCLFDAQLGETFK